MVKNALTKNKLTSQLIFHQLFIISPGIYPIIIFEIYSMDDLPRFFEYDFIFDLDLFPSIALILWVLLCVMELKLIKKLKARFNVQQKEFRRLLDRMVFSIVSRPIIVLVLFVLADIIYVAIDILNDLSKLTKL